MVGLHSLSRPHERRRLWWTLVVAAGAAMAPPACAAGTNASGRPQEPQTPSICWQRYHEVTWPEGESPWVDFILTPQVFDEARPDLADLRLFDGDGREVPYALRVYDRRESLPAKEVSLRRYIEYAEAKLDLGPDPAEHREMDVIAGGTLFSRSVQVEGSEDGANWSVLLLPAGTAFLSRYQVERHVIDDHLVRYPASRVRYLRVRVFPDTSQPSDYPAITSVTVYPVVPALKTDAVHFTTPVHQVVFARTPGLALPLRVYVGNPKAETSRYEFARTLKEVLDPPPLRATLGPGEENPDYQLEPKSWMERWPPQVYALLGAAAVAVLGMLAWLTRQILLRPPSPGPVMLRR